MRVLTDGEFRSLKNSRTWHVVDHELRETIRKLVGSDPLCACDSNLDEPVTHPVQGGFYIKWRAGWSADCSVDVRVRFSRAKHGGREFEIVTIEVVVNWSSSHRSVSNATACLSIYRRAVEFAAVIETMFEGEFLLYTDV